MANLGESVHSIQPLRKWCISIVERVETNTRPVIFKATLDLPLFVNEGGVMTGLAQLYPDYIPAPLAVDIQRNWMLMEDLGQPIGRDAPLDKKADLFSAMARIQIELIAPDRQPDPDGLH